MPVALRPEHGPTLPELVPARRRRTAAVAALALVTAIVLLSLRGAADADVRVVRESPVAFNFRHSEALKPVDPRPGELLRIERTVNGKFNQSFAVLGLELPPYEGDVGGILPVVAAAEIAALRERYASFELVEEGKARVNDVAGYQIVFRARLGERRLYGRLVMLPESIEGEPRSPRRGVRLLIESTPAAGVGRAEHAGVRGLNKKPFRSFRFGTEGP